MRPYSLDDAIKTFGKLLLQFISTFLIRFKKAVQFPEENKLQLTTGNPEGGGGGLLPYMGYYIGVYHGIGF